MSDLLSPLAYLCGQPIAKAKIKAAPEHFKVVEDLGYEFSGQGEHVMVCIRKTGENTSFVANELAKACGVKSKDVGWAGLKDRHAVTEQWLSVYLPDGKFPNLAAFEAQYPSIEVLAMTRHHKKLRPGDLRGNHFELLLSEVSDMDEVMRRLPIIAQQGVPNYFGQQRFGRDGNNVTEARRWGRDNVRSRNQNQRSLYLSAARSWIFNHIVSQRIQVGCFDRFIEGDIALKEGQAILISAEQLAEFNQQLALQQVQVSVALAGDNALPTEKEALLIEQRELDAEPELMALIRGNRMRHERRAISLIPQHFSWEVEGNTIKLKFTLDAGSFATSIIRELVEEIPVERVYE
ncbi:tRNA pseudouridine(13) synthase TruD [Vibrio cincinnatiensis]|uniref:tRNA pseudouridine(13) synthase TruD n=1 Tax=Vibrio cincinnatiensis TaxID=675 RepID=UPI001EDF7E1F|nr:tRNA pseudouridine(13) synthase TruD [Vibrio cincinnatiensis]MCG3759265.1 tRNA pseudouridine(13) synthase TruD [Vibrio cincinnatiensis]MCG3762566.1 tRNA pseudouridine(13) synthase TruD [Vibrio cincinnatiensis]